MMRVSLLAILVVAAAVLCPTSTIAQSGVMLAVGAPAPSTLISPGQGIGPITLGMPESELIRVLGATARPVVSGDERVFTFPPQGLTIWTLRGQVVRVRTANPNHRTLSGFGPGQGNWESARDALCAGVSARYDLPGGGFEIRCPFSGIVIEVGQGRITSLTVIPSEGAVPAGRSYPSRPSPLTLCGDIAYVSELVILQDGPFLDVYILLANRAGQWVAGDGIAFITFNGRHKVEQNVSCSGFKLFKRGRGAYQQEVFGVILPRLEWRRYPPETLREGSNSAQLRFWTTSGTFTKNETVYIRN